MFAEIKYHKDGTVTPQRRDYSVVYRVHADSGTADIATVLAASGLPDYSGTYPNDSAAYVTGYKASKVDKEGKEWEVVVDYAGGTSVMTFNQESKSYQYFGSPLEEVAVSGWTRVSGGAPLSGVAIRNSAGDPFDPPLMATRTLLNIKVKGSTASGNLSTLRGFITGYMNTVNSGAMTIDGQSYPAETLLLQSVEPEPATADRVGYTMSVMYKADTWVKPVIDAGTRANFSLSLTGYTGTQMGLREVRRSDVHSGTLPLSTKDGPLGQPVMLNGSGTLVGNKWVYDPTQPPVFLNFFVNQVKNWASLSGYL